MEQTEQQQKTTSEKVKENISSFIENLSTRTEKIAHTIVDKTSETGKKVSMEFNSMYTKAGDELNKLFNRLTQEDINDLKPGDLVLSSVDLTDGVQHHPKNQVFEFYEDLRKTPNVLSTLYFPTAKQAMNYGALKQVQQIKSMLVNTEVNPETDTLVRVSYDKIKLYVNSYLENQKKG